MSPLVAVAVCAIGLVGLNAWATRAVLRDDLSSLAQRSAQIAVVWLFPVLGASLTLYLKRKELEPGAGRYGEAPDVGDDFGISGQSWRELKREIDAIPHDSGDGGSGHSH